MSDLPIEKLCNELALAKEAYRAAAQRVSFAQNEATDALNRLNQKQRELEARMLTIAKDHPADSDWGRKRHDNQPLVGVIR